MVPNRKKIKMTEGTYDNPTNIRIVQHDVVLQRFKRAYAQENLSCAQTSNTLWFANDVACAALVRVTPIKYRIKATLTLPEYRGLGYGGAMLIVLVDSAIMIANREGSKSVIVESFARNPKWYLDNGFTVHRVTQWGVTVVRQEITWP